MDNKQTTSDNPKRQTLFDLANLSVDELNQRLDEVNKRVDSIWAKNFDRELKRELIHTIRSREDSAWEDKVKGSPAITQDDVNFREVQLHERELEEKAEQEKEEEKFAMELEIDQMIEEWEDNEEHPSWVGASLTPEMSSRMSAGWDRPSP